MNDIGIIERIKDQTIVIATYAPAAGMWPIDRCCGNIRGRCWKPGWRYSCSTEYRSKCTAVHSS